jgi:hypothetical protein
MKYGLTMRAYQIGFAIAFVTNGDRGLGKTLGNAVI